MPTRSLKLKLDLGGADRADIRKAIWTTHRLINEQVRNWEILLLLMRAEGFVTNDESTARVFQPEGDLERDAFDRIVLSEQTVIGALMRHLKDRTGGGPRATPPQCVALCRTYFAHVVEGDAQAAGGYCSPLIDPNSKAGEQGLRQAKAPDWLVRKREGKKWEEAAKAWIQEELKESPTGNPARYRKIARKNPSDLEWVEAYEKWLRQKETSASEGALRAFGDMRSQRLLPMSHSEKAILRGAPPTIASRLAGAKGVLSDWDRLAFRLAVGHILSWRSWNERAADERAKRRQEVDRLNAKLQEDPAAARKASLLQRYEAAHHQELMATALATDDNPYRLRPRAVRDLGRIMERWATALKKDPTADLWSVFADYQTSTRNRGGDPDLLRWLARTENREVWEDDLGRFISIYAKRNSAQSRVERSRPAVTFTVAHPLRHPRWVQYEAPGGTNLKEIIPLRVAENLQFEIPLLSSGPEGLEEIAPRIAAHPSGQFRVMELTVRKEEGKKTSTVLEFIQAPSIGAENRRTNARFKGVFRSPDILLDATHLRRLPEERLAGGHLGGAWIKVVLDVELQPVHPANLDKRGLMAASEDGTPYWATAFKKAAGAKAKREEEVQPGLGLLAIDLGVRSGAACTRWEIQEDGDGVPIRFGDRRLIGIESAPHARLLLLPGEETVEGRRIGSDLLPLPEEEARRSEQVFRHMQAELRLLRRGLTRRRLILRLSNPKIAPEIKDALTTRLGETMLSEEKDKDLLEAYARLAGEDHRVAELRKNKGHGAIGAKHQTAEARVPECALPDLAQACGIRPLAPEELKDSSALLRRWDAALGHAVGVWRKRERRKDPERRNVGGKSLRWIGHLEGVRRFLVSWHLRAGRSGEIRRLDRASQGTVAMELLDHINGLKDDRLKTLADLIVQTARGLRYDAGTRTWVESASPVPLILFEDLSRYRFKTDRTPRENSQLMQWAHRQLTEVVKQQAELFGIGVTTINAAFSSRYSGRSGAPGIRCRKVDAEDLREGWFRKIAERDGLDTGRLQDGDLIPWAGGEWFVTRSAFSGLLEIEQADINASRSIARRFLTRQAEAFRIRAKVDEKAAVAEPLHWGPQIAGALRMAFARLILTKEASGWVGRLQETKPAKENRAKAVENEGDDPSAEEVEETAVGPNRTFFRDPSGLLMPDAEWRESKVFWGRVRTQLLADLRRAGHCHG